jgi:DNA-directed RNA polymerase subunit RPC12/RpoP
MIYKCVLCDKNVKIEVYTINNIDEFVCPDCLQKKFKSRCIKCQKYIMISPNEVSKCFQCYKKIYID